MSGASDVVSRLASRRLAATLIALLLVWVLLGVIVPQADWMGPEAAARWRAQNALVARFTTPLGLNRLFSRWYFFATIAVLSVSIAACTLKRFLDGEHRPATPFLSPGAADKRGLEWHLVGLPAERAVSEAVSAMKRSRLRTETASREGGVGVTGWGGLLGFAGSIAFHVALLVIIAAGVVGTLSRFQGRMVLTTGQTVELRPTTFYSVGARPRLGSLPTDVAVGLDDLKVRYQGRVVTSVEADMHVLEGGRETQRRTVRVNYPLEVQGLSLLIDRAGYAARLRVSRKGKLLDDAFVNLFDKVAEGYKDTYTLPDGTALDVLVVPDAAARPGTPAENPLVLGTPAAYVRPAGSTSRPSGPISMGGTGKVGDLEVTLEDVRLWGEFLARWNLGRSVLYAGLWVGVAALVLRFLDPRREIMVCVQGKGRGRSAVALLGRSRYGRLGLGRPMSGLRYALGLPAEGGDDA